MTSDDSMDLQLLCNAINQNIGVEDPMNQIQTLLQHYITKYNNVKEISPLLNKDTKCVFGTIINILNLDSPETEKELEEAKNSNIDSVVEEYYKFKLFISNIKEIYNNIDKNLLSTEEYDGLIKDICDYLTDVNKDMQNLNNSMKDMNYQLKNMANALQSIAEQNKTK